LQFYKPSALTSRGFFILYTMNIEVKMNIEIKIYLSTEIIERNIEYPTQDKISFTINPGNQTVEVIKITLNGVEANKFYNTSFAIDNSDTVLTSVHEMTQKGVYTLHIDDLYLLSQRSNNWHCSELKEDFIFQYEFTRNSFTNTYRDRDHKGFDRYFIPCFGCSFTYGLDLPATDAWPHLLSGKTGQNYLNLGVSAIGIDCIYNNLTLLHKKHQFDQCIILFPSFARRIVRTKIDDLYVRLHSTLDYTDITSDFHLFRNTRVLDKLKKVKESIIKDTDKKYSKTFLNKIINYCKVNNVKLSVSSWDDEVYHYLQSQDHVNVLNKFPELSLFTERAHDYHGHPHRKHYQYFVNKIVKTL